MSTPEPDLKSIFGHAIELDTPEERAAYLDQACGDDALLRSEVEALLRASDQASGFMKSPAAAAAALGDKTVEHQSDVESPGAQIGPYKLLEQIGEGGMGVVYMADQQDPVRRRVALKIIKPGMDTRQVIARFEAERQALAVMDHPSIARVLDAGATDSGRPYFVMELVRGVPITTFCDENNLPVRERLELFASVCQAIQHAHTKGIIHRDIKPTNVLVTRQDGRPAVKVIDFGIAKAMGQKLTEKTLFTNFDQMIGTPLYMSPEQAEQSGVDIDTRSDIYSLGVLLYELLTGSTPVDEEQMKKAAFDEIRRIIREDEPQMPSLRISGSNTLPAIAAHRHIEPARLSRLVRGELDWIAMKALEKDRSRRYETANAFAADLMCYLHDEHVQACPPSAAYRFRKFASRNRVALVTTSLTSIAVLVAAGAAGWVVRDGQTRQAAVAARAEQAMGESESLYGDRKLPEAVQQARNALSLVEGGAVGPEVERRAREWIKDLNMVATLEEIHPGIEGDTPEELAVKLAEYPHAFREYGIDIEALAPAEAAARIAARPIHVDLAVTLDKWASYLYPRRREPSENEVALRDRLRQIARLADPDPVRNRLRQPARMEYADLQEIAATIDLATTPVATLIQIGDALDGPEERTEFYARLQQQHPNDFGITSALGNMLSKDRDPNRAVRYLTAAVAIRPQSATAHRDLGHALQRASRIVIDYYAANDPRRELKNALLRKRLVDEAAAEFLEVARLDPSDHNVRTARFRHAQELLAKGREEDAAAVYRALLPGDMAVRLYIGDQYDRMGKKDKALAAYRDAVRLEPKNAEAHNKLGTELAKQGLLDEAIAAHREAVRLNPKNADAQLNLGDVLKKKGLSDEATAAYRELFRLKSTGLDAYKEFRFPALLAEEKGLLDEVIADYRDAARREPDSAVAHANLGFALEKKGRLGEAVESYREAVRLRPADGGLRYKLGNAHARRGQWHEAVSAFEAAMHSPDYPNYCFGSPFRLATLYFHTNDQENYRRICHAILNWYGHSNIPTAEAAAMPCALAPGFGGDARLVIKLANTALDADHVKANLAMGGKLRDPDQYKRNEITKGLVDYRAGNIGAAAEIILHSAPSTEGTHRDALAFSVLAMAQHRLGKLDESRTSFANAQQIIEMKMPNVEKGETFQNDWPEWLHAQILHREATELLKITDEKPTPKPVSK